MNLGVYSDDELEAIRAAIAHVTPTSVIENAEHLLCVVEYNAVGAKQAEASLSSKPKPSEQAADIELEADKMLSAAKAISSLDIVISVLNKGDDIGAEQTASNLVTYANQLKDHAKTLREWPYRKGKNNKAYPFLQCLLGLWVAAGQEISRYNKTSDFLEAAAKPIFPDEIKENTVDSFIRTALKKPWIYAGMKPPEFSGAEKLH